MITEGSVWWTIAPSQEDACGEQIPPQRVKAHPTRPASSGWWLSTLDDRNSRFCRDEDVGRTLFLTEVEAWTAYLGAAPTTASIAKELEDRASHLGFVACLADTEVAQEAVAPHIAALREIARKVRAS